MQDLEAARAAFIEADRLYQQLNLHDERGLLDTLRDKLFEMKRGTHDSTAA
jgi:hypothetical protein